MIDVAGHARETWARRGDITRLAREAWENGVKVEVDGYDYDKARLDEQSNTVLLARKGEIRTVIKVYDNVRVRPVIEVECYECNSHHHNTESCPICGSDRWRLR